MEFREENTSFFTCMRFYFMYFFCRRAFFLVSLRRFSALKFIRCDHLIDLDIHLCSKFISIILSVHTSPLQTQNKITIHESALDFFVFLHATYTNIWYISRRQKKVKISFIPLAYAFLCVEKLSVKE